MKHTNKKGFTIVELVIVIAVIAILAAVLIPTFSNLIKKANLSADQQAVRQMNTVLAAEQDLGADIDRVIDVLAENGYNSKGALIPVSTGYAFFYYADAKCIVLVNTEKSEVVYPAEIEYVAEGEKAFNLEGSAKYIDVAADNYDVFKDAIGIGSEKIVLSGNFVVNEELTIPAGANVTLDLNQAELTTAKTGERSKYLNTNGALTILNGTINARGVQSLAGSNVVINDGVTINSVDFNGGACVWTYADSNTVIEGGTFITEGDGRDGNGPGLVNNSGIVTIKGGTFTSENSFSYAIINSAGTMTIDGGNFTASRGVVVVAAGTAKINGGYFEKTGDWSSSYVLYAQNSSVVEVTGGEFVGNIHVDETATLKISGGSFSVEINKVANVTIAEGKTVVKNAETGLWDVVDAQ